MLAYAGDCRDQPRRPGSRKLLTAGRRGQRSSRRPGSSDRADHIVATDLDRLGQDAFRLRWWSRIRTSKTKGRITERKLAVSLLGYLRSRPRIAGEINVLLTVHTLHLRHRSPCWDLAIPGNEGFR